MNQQQNKLNEIKGEASTAIASAADKNSLFLLKSQYLGKKSNIAAVLATLKDLSLDEKRDIGAFANQIKTEITQAVEDRLTQIEEKAGALNFDPSLPGLKSWEGTLHPLTQVMEELKSIFVRMGFSVAEGPEVETDYYSFEALNTPKHHPARDMQDTFYVTDEILLRPHTSPVQIRVMEGQKPPIRIIAPGRVYRNEAVSARSYCLFHQVEGLYVDKGVSFADLKGTIHAFVKALFGDKVKTRFRPSFFPFTEPSAEADVECFLCATKGCPVCKQTGWLEILGCGMVHPNVLKNGFKYHTDINMNDYTGFAFGMGVERIAMLKYAVDDIRLFYENDVRFLSQFRETFRP